MKYYLNILLFCSLTTIYFLLSTNVSAQQLSLSLSPPLTELIIKPGQATVIKYRLTNIGDPTITKIRILPFEPKDNQGNISIIDSLQSPIQFWLEKGSLKLEEPFFLKNSESQEFWLSVNIPEVTPAKDYYFTLLAETQPPPTQEGVVNVRTKVSIGSNLLISVTKKGEVEIKPKISLFTVVPKNKISLLGFKINLFSSFEKIPVVLIVENNGKNLIKPQGEIILSGPLWQRKRFEIKPQTILAESQRQTPLELPGFLLGNYRLSANLSLGQGTPTLYASTSFLVFPIKLFILIILLFLAAI